MARVDLRDNEFMEQFVSQNHIDSNDVQFWYQLLSCSFNFMRVQDPRVVDKTLDPYLVRLVLNNSESANVGSLLRVFLDRVSRIKSPSGTSTNPYYVFQSFNALYLIRSICKSYIESLSEEQLVKAFRAKVDQPAPSQTQSQAPLPPVPPQQYQKQQQQLPPIETSDQQQPIQLNGTTDASNHNVGQPMHSPLPPIQSNVVIENQQPPINEATVGNPIQVQDQTQETSKKAEFTEGIAMLDQYISTLVAIIVDIPLSDSTYLLQVEAINGLLVLLSVQMYSNTPANQSFIYRSLMQKKCSTHALILTKTLLNNFVNQQPMPQESGSIIIGLASGLWKVLTLGYGSQEEEEEESMPLLARQSLLILNILTNHYTSEKNPYREAIVSCQDSRHNLSSPQTTSDNANNDALVSATTSKAISNSINIDFHKFYETICKYLNNDQVALLLYLLLHSNKIFRPYILTTASKELDRLVLPLLKILYSSIERGSHHVYMVLILFIILSEEPEFNTSIHQIIVRSVPWYKDRALSEISLGSLTALIIIRSFQYNTFRIKDKFLHTNLFATLANLSNYFHNLHPYVCQRLVDLLERLTKRYLMLTKSDQLEPNQPVLPPGKQINYNLMNENMDPLAKALATDTHKQDLQDASSIELDSSNIMTNNNNNEILGKQNGGINIGIPNQQVAPTMGNYGSGGVVMMEQSPTAPTNDSITQQQQQRHQLQQQMDEAGGNSGQQSPKSTSQQSDHINISMDDGRQDVGLIEEVIRMILEVINNSLAVQLKSNPDLIYTLLYKRSVFNSLLSSHQSFYNMVINVERIITFFYNKIETSGEGQLTVEEVKELIRTTSNKWQEFDLQQQQQHQQQQQQHQQQQQQQVMADGSKGGPKDLNATSRLLFHYVEDEQPEDFFIPYIWTRIYYSSGIVWNSKRIVLFNPDDL